MDSDDGLGVLFRNLANMISTSLIQDENNELTLLQDDPWAKHVDVQWNMHFEQREPPTEDKIVYANMGDENILKPIFISKSLSSYERQDLIFVI